MAPGIPAKALNPTVIQSIGTLMPTTLAPTRIIKPIIALGIRYSSNRKPTRSSATRRLRKMTMRIIPARIVNGSMLAVSRLIRYKSYDFVVLISTSKSKMWHNHSDIRGQDVHMIDLLRFAFVQRCAVMQSAARYSWQKGRR
jgi:hypothetical protein